MAWQFAVRYGSDRTDRHPARRHRPDDLGQALRGDDRIRSVQPGQSGQHGHRVSLVQLSLAVGGSHHSSALPGGTVRLREAPETAGALVARGALPLLPFDLPEQAGAIRAAHSSAVLRTRLRSVGAVADAEQVVARTCRSVARSDDLDLDAEHRTPGAAHHQFQQIGAIGSDALAPPHAGRHRYRGGGHRGARRTSSRSRWLSKWAWC